MSLLIIKSGIINPFEKKAFDLFSRLLNPQSSSSQNIVIVAIDQHSIDEMNKHGVQWPWPRQIYAPILEYVSEASAAFVDILYTEPSSYGIQDDEILAHAIKQSGNVYMPIFLTNQDRPLTSEEMHFVKKFSTNLKINRDFPTYRSMILPIEQLRAGIKGLGNVTVLPDEDGVYRQIPLFCKWNEQLIPNFVISYFINDKKLTFHNGELRLDEKTISTFDDKVLMRFYKSPKPFNEISATDILVSYTDLVTGKTPQIKRDYFKDKFVFIGLTAAGLYDLKPTSVSPISTGIIIHGTLFDNLLNQSFFRPIGKTFIYLVMLIISLTTSCITVRYHSLWVNLCYFFAMVCILLCVSAIFFKYGFYQEITSPILSLCLSSMIAITYSYATEGKERIFIRRTFSQYMDEKLVEYLLKNPDLIKPGGQKRYMTVFFADIAGFTNLAEKLSPEDITTILTRVLNAFTEIIIKNHGVIDKYIGDCVMAFWGAPEKTENDEFNACNTALQCIDALKKLNEDFKKEGLQEISMRIGINSGNAIVGNLGSNRLFDYTVVGDTVNLASRLEGVNKLFGTHIIASEQTITPIRQYFIFRELGLIEVKGKDKAVRIYEVIGQVKDNIQIDWLTTYEKALNHFYELELNEALEVFTRLHQQYPYDKVVALYVEKCQSLINKKRLTESDLLFKMDMK